LRRQLAQQEQLQAIKEEMARPVELDIPKPTPRRSPLVSSLRNAGVVQSISAPEVANAVQIAQVAPGGPVGLLQAADGRRLRFYAKSGSKMRLEGTSNIHDWQVESSLIGGFIEVGSNFPIEPGQPAKPGEFAAEAEPFIIVHSLKSVEKDGKPYSDTMDQAMYGCLRATENPKVVFHLIQLTLKEPAKSRERPYLFEAKGELELAGVTNEINMPVDVLPLSGKKLKISGTSTVKLTDFEIDPATLSPSLGMIKIGDDVKLSFEWMVAQTNWTSAPGVSAMR
jgi:hypothetical protein